MVFSKEVELKLIQILNAFMIVSSVMRIKNKRHWNRLKSVNNMLIDLDIAASFGTWVIKNPDVLTGITGASSLKQKTF